MDSVEIAAITVGLTEIAKTYGLPDRLCPLMAIFLAIALSFVAGFRLGKDIFDVNTIIDLVSSGLIIGLTATGLYKAGKNVIKTGR